MLFMNKKNENYLTLIFVRIYNFFLYCWNTWVQIYSRICDVNVTRMQLRRKIENQCDCANIDESAVLHVRISLVAFYASDLKDLRYAALITLTRAYKVVVSKNSINLTL